MTVDQVRTKRLLTIVGSNAELGGLEVSVARLLEELAARGRELLVLVEGESDEQPTAAFFARRLPHASAAGKGRWRSLRWADVVHVHGATRTMWSRRAVATAILLRRPILLTVHLPSEPRPRPTKLGRLRDYVDESTRAWLLRIVGAVCLAPSAAAARHLESAWRGRVAVRAFYNGVPGPDDRPPAPGGDGLGVAFIGRLAPHKRPEVFIDAVSEAVRMGARVAARVVGAGPMESELRRKAAELQLPDGSIKFTGHLDDPSSAIVASDVLVLTSAYEGCPTVVLEAAAHCRPALVREGLEGLDELLPGAHLTVPEAATGYDFGKALVRAGQDKTELRRVGAAARLAYESLFSVSVCSDAYELLLRNVGSRS